MALERKLIRDRFDVATFEIARLASQGYALVPLSVKLSGIVMYATMEINTDQVSSEVKTEVKSETTKVDTDKVADASPVKTQVTTARTKKVKDA